MRSVGPKVVVDDQGVGTNVDEAEEDYEFLVHLLRRWINLLAYTYFFTWLIFQTTNLQAHIVKPNCFFTIFQSGAQCPCQGAQRHTVLQSGNNNLNNNNNNDSNIDSNNDSNVNKMQVKYQRSGRKYDTTTSTQNTRKPNFLWAVISKLLFRSNAHVFQTHAKSLPMSWRIFDHMP